MPIGKVTHVFKQRRCVAVRTSVVLVAGADVLRFEKGDPDQDLPGVHLSQHPICSMEINHQQVEACLPHDEVAIRIPSGPLPPNNAQVFLHLGLTG